MESKVLYNLANVKKTACSMDFEKRKIAAYKKLAKKMTGALSFLYYNDIPYKRVLDNPDLFQKNPFTMEGIYGLIP
jgi:hypothetical protein